MPVSHARWAAYEKEQAAARDREQAPAREMTRQAAVRMEQLTQDAAWDKYLTLLQPQLEAAREQVALSKTAAATATTDEDIRRAQLHHAHSNAIVATLEHVMSLPKQLVEQGREPASP